MLSVQLLGGISIFLDGQRLPLDIGGPGRLLTGYLLEFQSRPHRRDRLVDIFWGDLGRERGRAALNTAIWRLRKTLALETASKGGGNLISSGTEVVLEPASWLSIDTHSFERSVRTAFPGLRGAMDLELAARLEAATSTYRGPFLDGEDGDWILEERERLHSLYVRALTDLVGAYAASERYEEAIDAARRILSVDRFRESILRQFLLLLVLNGQRVDAIRYAARWKAALREELNLSPMPQTLALEAAIAAGASMETVRGWTQRIFAPGVGDIAKVA